MTKPMMRRTVVAALKAQKCSLLREGAEHTVYECPCGQHKASVPRHRQITPGVVRKIEQQMSCLGEGWLT